MKDVILSIAGKPGLFRLVALNDVCMYTEEEDKPLMEIFESCKQATDGKPTAFTHKDATNDQLVEFMAAAVPNFDRDRVHMSDIRKLVQWYNILITNGYTEFVDAEETAEA